MGVLLCFGDTQLGLTHFGHVLAQGVGQLSRWEGRRCINAVSVAGQHNESSQLGTLFQGKAIKALVGEDVSQLTGTVGTEIHENQGVAIVQEGWLAAFWNDGGGLHELIVFITGISRFQTFYGSFGGVFTFTGGEQIPSQLNPLPTLVTIHGVITANDRSNATNTQFMQQGIGFGQ